MGFDGVQQIVKLAEENGKKCLLGQMLELGIAGTAEAHCALAHPTLIQPHEIGSYRLLGITEDIIHERVVTNPNYFSLFKGHGLGITINEEIIEACRVDHKF